MRWSLTRMYDVHVHGILHAVMEVADPAVVDLSDRPACQQTVTAYRFHSRAVLGFATGLARPELQIQELPLVSVWGCDMTGAASAIGKSAAWVAGSALCVAGGAKLMPASRRAAPRTALASILPSAKRQWAPAVSTAIGLAELCLGAGFITRQQAARAVAPATAAAITSYALLAAKRAPEQPCGCLGAASADTARAGMTRALFMSALCLASLAGRGDHRRGAGRSEIALRTGGTATLALLLFLLSPERREIARRARRRRAVRQLSAHGAIMKTLPESKSWRVLAPVVAPEAPPSFWRADGNHYVEFRARPDSGASAVAFVAYLPDNDDAISFRGVLVNEESGEVLLTVHG